MEYLDGISCYRCHYCPKTFTHKCLLDVHEERHEEGNQVAVKLEIDDDLPSDEFHTELHDELNTVISLPFECKICLKRYKTGVLLSRHETLHSRPFTCQWCSKKFAVEVNLRMHVQQCLCPEWKKAAKYGYEVRSKEAERARTLFFNTPPTTVIKPKSGVKREKPFKIKDSILRVASIDAKLANYTETSKDFLSQSIDANIRVVRAPIEARFVKIKPKQSNTQSSLLDKNVTWNGELHKCGLCQRRFKYELAAYRHLQTCGNTWATDDNFFISADHDDTVDDDHPIPVSTATSRIQWF